MFTSERSDPNDLFFERSGEGAVDMWVHGRFIKCAEPLFSWAPGEGCRKNCDGRWLSLDKSEWWAQIRLKDGSTGWVQAMGKFEGTDALSYRRD